MTAIIRMNELIVAALIFGMVIGLAANAQGTGAPGIANIVYYLSPIPHYLSDSLSPSNRYGAI